MAKANKGQQKSSITGWLITVGLVGGFAGFLYYLDTMPSPNADNGRSIEKKDNSRKNEQAIKTGKNEGFEFYTILPKQKVDIADEEVRQKAPVTTRDAVEKPQPVITGKDIAPPVSKPQQEKQPVPVVSKSQGEVKKSPSNNGKLVQLQVGAFHSLDKADAMKARLAFLGIESNIQVVPMQDGKRIYRVRVGPTRDQEKVNQIQKQLKAENINTYIQYPNG